mgnify:CR=1 FL=1
MAYKYETQYDSPNFTPGNQTLATYGRPRTIEAIAIHWWGDPNTNPTYEGVIATLCNPARQASAHFVATGTGRRVAQLVVLTDTSWATNSANPYTISIECDPRCRNEDYDVVAELIAELRAEYGNLPLVPHRQFVATACPGNYDLARLDREARAKTADKNANFGEIKSSAPAPSPSPAPTPASPLINEALKYMIRVFSSEVKGWDREKVHRGDYDEQEMKFWKGKSIADFSQGAWNEGEAYRALQAKWKDDSAKLAVIAPQLQTVIKSRDEMAVQLAAARQEIDRLNAEIASKPIESPSSGGFTESDRTVLQDIKNVLQSLSDGFKRIFK